MTWAKFPLNMGAVNSRPASALNQGEFTETSGCAYKPNSDQLHSDLAWDTLESNLLSEYSNLHGPFYLNFESTNDWLMMVGTASSGQGLVFFRRSNGTGSWKTQGGGGILDDNLGNKSGVSAASVTHWGDRYYLATDQGCREIAPPSGSGAPVVSNLGYEYYDRIRYASTTAAQNGIGSPSIMPIGNSTAETAAGGSSGSISWVSTSTESDLVAGDFVTIFYTEYSTVTGKESYPIWYESRQVQTDGEYPTILFPGVFINSDANQFRAYIKFWYNTNTGSTVFEDNTTYNEVISYRAAVVGASLLTSSGSEFGAGDVKAFQFIQKSFVTNPLPVLAVDNARLIYQAYRYPSPSTAAAVWNDSLVLGDSGHDNGTDTAGTPSPITGTRTDSWSTAIRPAIPTIMRYSPPGEPWNQPVPYFMNFASEREDDIKALQVVNDRMLVLCDQAVHSVRYLPFNNLLASQQGRVKDVVTTNVGLASPKAVAKVETPRGEMCVWLSQRGLEWSDGTGWDDACPDFTRLSWMSDTFYDGAVLVAIPSEYRLDLYIGFALYSFYYHPSHIKNGHLKMLGPTYLNGIITGACEYKGTVYRVRGSAMEWTNTDNRPDDAEAYTGFIYGSNPFKDVSIKDLALTHSAINGTILMRCDSAVVGNALELGSQISLDNADIEETGSSGIGQRGNYVRFKFKVNGGNDWSVGPAWIQGDEDSGGRG